MNNKSRIFNKLSKIEIDDNTLGVFAIGEINYGFINSDNFKIVQIVVPDFSQLCLRIKTKYVEKDNIIIDLVTFSEFISSGDVYLLEVLFTKYFILNEKYSYIFSKYFLDENMNNQITNSNKYLIKKNIYNKIDIESENDNKFEIYRLYYLLDLLNKGENFCDCIDLSDTEYFQELWNLKNKNVLPNRKFSKEQEEQEQNDNKELLSFYTSAVRVIEYFYFDRTNSISEDIFIQTLTNLEEKAYYELLKKIGDEGTITLSGISKDTSISTNTYKNLIEKLKNNKIALIENDGRKINIKMKGYK